MQNEKLLTQAEAATRLQLSPRTLEQYRTRGGGPLYVRISARCVRYRPEDLDAWISERIHANTHTAANQGTKQ
jgi:predicted DNA-binding transcriptional regulator AlpA